MRNQKTLCALLSGSVIILFVFVLVRLYLSFQSIDKETFVDYNSSKTPNKEVVKIQKNIINYLKKSKNPHLDVEKKAQEDEKIAAQGILDLKNKFLVESFQTQKELQGKQELEHFNTQMGISLDSLFKKDKTFEEKISELETKLDKISKNLSIDRTKYPRKFYLSHAYKGNNNTKKVLKLALMELGMGNNKTDVFIIPQSETGKCLHVNTYNELELYDCMDLYEDKLNQGLLFRIQEEENKYLITPHHLSEEQLFLGLDNDTLILTNDRFKAIKFEHKVNM